MLCYQGDARATPGVILGQYIVMSQGLVSPYNQKPSVFEIFLIRSHILVSAINEPHQLPVMNYNQVITFGLN